MATLTVWKFETTDGAQRAEDLLVSLQKQELIQVQDAAIVYWEPGTNKPKTRQSNSTTGMGALGGTFWGMLFGLIFFIPLLGAAIGAATGAIAGSLTDVGINDDFIHKVRDEIVPGTSALFALTSGAVMDKVHEELRAQNLHPQLIQTNLTDAEEAKLREVFADA